MANLDKLKEIVRQANQSLTRSDFRAAFQRVVRIVQAGHKDIKDHVERRISAIERTPGPPGRPGRAGDSIKGDKGDPGDSIKGDKGDPGEDADENAIHDRVYNTLSKNLPQLGEAIRDAIELLQGDDRLDVSSLRGIPELIEQHIAKQPYSMGGGAVVSIQVNGTNKVNQASTLNLKGSGAPTVSLGANGVTELDFPSASGISELLATGLVNGTNAAFTFTEQPTYIVSDGVFMKAGKGWSWNSGTLTATMDIPPSLDIYGIA